MDKLIPSLFALVAIEHQCFRAEVYEMFRSMLGGWIVCLGRRTISRVWETTGRSGSEDHSAAFRLFSEAVWNWDEVCRLLILEIVMQLLPGSKVWLVVDETLCHKTGRACGLWRHLSGCGARQREAQGVSASKLSADRRVGAQWTAAVSPATRRLNSFGRGDCRSPVRAPASTCTKERRR